MSGTPRVVEPRRPLGRTGFIATPLGIGDLADRAVPIDDCVATARRAIDAGLNLSAAEMGDIRHRAAVAIEHKGPCW